MKARIIARRRIRRRRSPARGVASTGASGGTAAQQHHRLASGGRAGHELGAESSQAANAAFQREHPGVARQRPVPDVGDHLQKFDATLAGGNAPDVIEMGNTEMTKYMAAGAFQDITSDRASIPELGAPGSPGSPPRARSAASSTACRTTRARASSPTAPTSSRRPGSRVPTSLAAVHARPRRSSASQNSGEGVLADLHRGHGLVRRDELRLRLRRARSRGRSAASGRARSPRRRRSPACTAYKGFFSAVSKASKTTDETRPNPYDVYAQGQAGSMIGPGWFSCCVGDKYKATTGQFVLPSRQKGQPMPGFLGGSDLAVPVGAQQVARPRLGQGLHEQRSR